ncbi:hypothetical protein GW17_00010075 [Ensete ventricosum]|nr:hypothetical protein GW17_00010075 [Ensete ventricosum]
MAPYPVGSPGLATIEPAGHLEPVQIVTSRKGASQSLHLRSTEGRCTDQVASSPRVWASHLRSPTRIKACLLQEWDYVVSWVLHFDGTDSSCMVSKTKGVSRYLREAFDNGSKATQLAEAKLGSVDLYTG